MSLMSHNRRKKVREGLYKKSVYLLYVSTQAPQRPILEAINGTCQLCALVQHPANRLANILQPDHTFGLMSV